MRSLIGSMVLAVILSPALSHAADVGQFFSPIGDTVTIRLARDGNYIARIETNNQEGGTCTFEKKMREVEEGDLRYHTNSCSVRVLQDGFSSLGVTVIGCEQFCDGDVNLRITRATKD